MNLIVRSTIGVAAVLVALHCGAVVAAAQTADLSIEKFTFADPAAAGADFSYFMFVSNNGPDTARNVLMTDVMPTGVTFESAQTSPDGLPCTFNPTVQTLTCNLGDIVAFDGVFVEVSVRAPSYAGTIVNTAGVSSSTPDPNPADNTSTVSTNVVQYNLSDLAVTMTASASSVLVHRSVTFTTTVTNLGPHDAAGVQLTLSPPFLADIISLKTSRGTCTQTTDSIDCALGPMPTGASAVVTLEVKPQKDGFALTFASVSGYGDPLFFDPNPNNDFADVSVDVNYPGNANPAFTKTTTQIISQQLLIPNTCTGDYIYLSGMVRQVVSSTFSPGEFHVNTLTNYNGLTGVGLISGTTYRATGTSRFNRSLNLVFGGFFPYAFNQVENVRLVGSGGQSLVLHENFHVTVGLDGTATTVVDNPVIVCQ